MMVFPGQSVRTMYALSYYANLVDNMILMVTQQKEGFGFCINDCSDSNVNAEHAAAIINDLNSIYPCNGGAYFWVVSYTILIGLGVKPCQSSNPMWL
jgi:hypothetical protein